MWEKQNCAAVVPDQLLLATVYTMTAFSFWDAKWDNFNSTLWAFCQAVSSLLNIPDKQLTLQLQFLILVLMHMYSMMKNTSTMKADMAGCNIKQLFKLRSVVKQQLAHHNDETEWLREKYLCTSITCSMGTWLGCSK